MTGGCHKSGSEFDRLYTVGMSQGENEAPKYLNTHPHNPAKCRCWRRQLKLACHGRSQLLNGASNYTMA